MYIMTAYLSYPILLIKKVKRVSILWVVDEAGEIIELSQVSEIVAAMTRADLKQDEKIYYPNDQVARAGRKKQ